MDFETQCKNLISFDRYLGMDLSVIAPGDVTYSLEIKEHHLAAPHSAHGGVIAAMMEATLGLAALSYAVTLGNLSATVEFKINYIRPAGQDSTLTSHGRIKHTGKSLIVSEGNIRDKASGDLIATGLGTFNQYPMDKRKDVPKIAVKP